MHHIATNFYTCHDSKAVVPCARFHSDHFITISTRAEWNFHPIWILMEISFVKWVPGLTWYYVPVHGSDLPLIHHRASRAPSIIPADALHWRHNDHDGVSNHQPHGCLLNRLFRRRSKKTSKLRVTGLCVGNSPGTGEFPGQMASNAENVSIWWRHHVKTGPQTFVLVQIKENTKAPRHWPLCWEFTGTGEFPAKKTSYAENVCIWWRHHGQLITDPTSRATVDTESGNVMNDIVWCGNYL